MAVTADDLLKALDEFPWDEWNQTLSPLVTRYYGDLVIAAGRGAADATGGSWDVNDPYLSRFINGYVGERITQLSGTTRDDVGSMIRRAFESAGSNISVQELAARIGAAVREKFESYKQYRALRIARTETAIAFNHGQVLGYAQGGVSQVDVLDGTDDRLCADAHAKRWPLRQALENPVAHPNCQRAFAPVVPENQAPATTRERNASLLADTLLPQLCATAAEHVAQLEDPHDRPLNDPDDND